MKNTLDEILNNDSLTKEQKVEIINKYFEARNAQIDKELNNYITKQYAGAILEIGSATIPTSGVGRIGAQVGKQILTSQTGRKIAQNIGAGILSGGASGGVFGLGSGLMNDTNPIISSATGVVEGAALGGTLGAIGANIEKAVKGKNLKNYGNIDELSSAKRKQYSKDVRGYYQDYIQERKLDKNGQIDLSKPGVQEQLRWNPQQAQNYPELLKDIKNAKRLPDEPNLKPDQKPDVSHYEVYQGKNGKHYIEVSSSGKKRYYITKETTGHATRTTSTNAPVSYKTLESSDHATSTGTPESSEPSGSVIRATSTGASGVSNTSNNVVRATSTGAIGSANNNINDFNQDYNPQSGILYGYLNYLDNNGKDASTNNNASIDNTNHVFTPEEIGKMSPEEFNKNEAAIMEQVKNGKITQSRPQIILDEYTTTEGTEMIFTKEDLDNMSTKEFTKHEKSIWTQMKKIGIPNKNQLPKNTKTFSSEKAKNSNSDSKNGKWVTINGNHVFIED